MQNMQWKPKLPLSLEVCFNQITSNKSMSILYNLNENINNKARHNLVDAKYRWRSDQLDSAGSFLEPLGQMKVTQIRQRETTHEICCLVAL